MGKKLNPADYIGKKYGLLTVIGQTEKKKVVATFGNFNVIVVIHIIILCLM